MEYYEISFQDLLKESALTEEIILHDLEAIAGYVDDMKLHSELVPSSVVPMPTLVIGLEPDEKERIRMLNCSFLPLDEESAVYTKYIQLYLELQNDLSAIEPDTRQELVNRCNSVLPFGHAMLIAPRPEYGMPAMIGVRTVQGFPLMAEIDQGVFTEDVFLLDMNCSVISKLIDDVAGGMDISAAFAQFGF